MVFRNVPIRVFHFFFFVDFIVKKLALAFAETGLERNPTRSILPIEVLN
jgi:hypothetical protein